MLQVLPPVCSQAASRGAFIPPTSLNHLLLKVNLCMHAIHYFFDIVIHLDHLS